MTDITRVPLQPIAKGSLTKLWLGVLAVALAAAALAFMTSPAWVKLETIKEGSGPKPKMEDVVWVKYVGKLDNGKVFEDTNQFPKFPVPGILPDGIPMLVERNIPGFVEGLQKMQAGGKYVIHIPAEKAYGAEEKRNEQTGEIDIPANSNLNFEIEVVAVMSKEEAQQKIQVAQAKMMEQEAAAQPKDGKGAKDAAGAEAEAAPEAAPKKK